MAGGWETVSFSNSSAPPRCLRPYGPYAAGYKRSSVRVPAVSTRHTGSAPNQGQAFLPNKLLISKTSVVEHRL